MSPRAGQINIKRVSESVHFVDYVLPVKASMHVDTSRVVMRSQCRHADLV